MLRPAHGPETSAADAAARIRALGRDLTRADDAPLPPAMQELEGRIRTHRSWIEPLRAALHEAVIGRTRLIDRLLIALIAGRPLLIEGPTGLARTTALRHLAAGAQLTLASLRLHRDTKTTELILPDGTGPRGALFANLLLADDIDEAPTRVQDALLSAARDRRLAREGELIDLPRPFLLVASQRPARRAGAHPLDETRLERFFLRVRLDYPSPADEREILARRRTAQIAGDRISAAAPQVDAARLCEAQDLAAQVHVGARIEDYLVTLIDATRNPGHYGLHLERYLRNGASSRTTRDLEHAAQVVAFLRGGAYVKPQDVQAVFADVVGHRLGLRSLAAVEGLGGDDVAAALLASIPAPASLNRCH